MREYDYEFKLMGSDASICIVAPSEGIADTVYARMRKIGEEAEARFSRFLPESELSLLNKRRSMRVSPEFMDVFLRSRELTIRSDFAFNPLTDISRFGYDADIAQVQGRERGASSLNTPYNLSIESIVVDEHAQTISLSEGQNLDFGGFLKGHIAEVMARSASLCDGVVVNIGGDLFTTGVDTDGIPFSFSVDHPRDFNLDIPFVAKDEAVATSGTYNRRWTLEGESFHHILDRSGSRNPETDVISATVIAPTGAEADAFAKVAIVLGSAKGAQMLDSLGFRYCFIHSDGSVRASSSFPLHSSALNLYAY